MKPERDWKIIFIASLTLVLVLTIFNIFIYFGLKTSEQGELEPQTQTLDLEKLKHAVSYYQAKEKEFGRIIRNFDSPFPDPSL